MPSYYRFMGSAWRKTKHKDFNVHETAWVLVNAESAEAAEEKAMDGLKKFLRPEAGYSAHSVAPAPEEDPTPEVA